MNRTIKNLKENKKVSIISGYIRLRGESSLFTSGKYFYIAVIKSIGYKVKNAILIEIKEV